MNDSVSREIGQIWMQKPHVVILGAGCSRAALPEGDANGVRLPVMQDFLEIVKPLGRLFKRAGLSTEGKNIETIYSDLVATGATDIKREAEVIIFNHFQALQLPDGPTLYDHLFLSLREKDVIATFNWDPFLVQAARRCWRVSRRGPHLLFLHGNVMVGFCAIDSRLGPVGQPCSICGRGLSRSRLLYPVLEKNYDDDPMISACWKQISADLERSFMVTIFGYSAPSSDAVAVQLLKDGLGDPERRLLKQVEIIDIKPREQLWTLWEPFIKAHHYHYKIHPNFYESWIARHPRRSGEAYVNQNIDGEIISDNPIPANLDFAGLRNWMMPLIEVEDRSQPSGTS